MHQVAEYGVAAHWAYKEGVTPKIHFGEDKIGWSRSSLLKMRR